MKKFIYGVIGKILIIIAVINMPIKGSEAGEGVISKEELRSQTIVEIKNNWFYVNGERFFINAVGYAPWRPHQWPPVQVDLKLIERDFKLIKEAGFNTIRTWSALSEEELRLAKRYGLFVIQGIWVNPDLNFSDPRLTSVVLREIGDIAKYSKKYDNVLMYLVITEPRQEAVLYAGIDKTIKFFKRIKQTIQSIDNKPVSMNTWIPIGFLNHSLWDVITFNAFMFTPESINRSIGFRNYIRWFKNTHARAKPFVIGETGGFSVSRKKLNDLGFGGNTEEEQSRGNIESINEAIASGANGVCTVSWIDTWHFPSDPHTHNDHPWEWTGILGIDTDKDFQGIPRKVYYDLKEFNQALIVEPRQMEYYSGILPVEIYAQKGIKEAFYRIDTNEWLKLNRESAHWWSSQYNLSRMKEGKHTLEVKIKKDGKWIKKETQFLVYRTKKPFLSISLVPKGDNYVVGEPIKIKIKVRDEWGKPVINQSIDYGFFVPIGWKEQMFSGVTNKEGELVVTYRPSNSGYIVFSAGSVYKKNRKRYGDLVFIRVVDQKSPVSLFLSGSLIEEKGKEEKGSE